MRRRSFLMGLGALGASALAGARVAVARAETDRRFVLVILRGGMDGLSAVPAWGDPAYRSARGDAAVTEPLDLDGMFGLHPALAPVLPLYQRGQLLAVHAVAPPYRERSHFDGQDVLENGTEQPFGAKTGWLNRALAALEGQPPAMAVGRALPLVLRGPADVTSADPLRPIPDDERWLDKVRDLYGDDAVLGPALEQGLRTREMLAAHRGAAPVRGRDAQATARIVGSVLAASDGPRVAVLEMGGWDTHAQQEGTLQRQLGTLADALLGFADGAGDAWSDTVVLAVTEFGRTVRGNGTGGSDHGIGSVALLAGGAVRGGRVVADWPGLREPDLVDGRDLRATTDVRSVFKGVLRDHLGVREGARGRDG